MLEKNQLNQVQILDLLGNLEARFEKNQKRHKNLKWSLILSKIHKNEKILLTLYKMEQTGGEPDIVELNGKIVFVDCAKESPLERRSLCYDRQALDARKANKPKNNALDVAQEIGIEILTEADYRFLQTLGEFDLKTSSWIATPPEIRQLGGALFCDRRYNTVFVYHNGADSYYAARGFRGYILI